MRKMDGVMYTAVPSHNYTQCQQQRGTQLPSRHMAGIARLRPGMSNPLPIIMIAVRCCDINLKAGLNG